MKGPEAKGFVGGYAKITATHPTAKQIKALKLSGAKRQFRLGLFVCVLSPYNISGNVKGYRLKGDEVQIKVGSKWYPKYLVSKDPRVIKALKRKMRGE